MRVVLLFLFAGSAVAQETHLSNQSAFSINPFFGRYNSEYTLGARVAYALKGSAQLSYTYSTVLTSDPVANFQNEYFLRFYGPTGRRFFLSAGFGYIFQRATTKEVFGFRLSQNIEGVGLEGGMHLVAETSEKRRVAVSLYYLYHKATAEMSLSGYPVRSERLLRSITLEAALAHYFGAKGVVIGPRLTVDWEFSNAFVGVHSAFLLRH